jgi:hypothetical protein
MNVTAEARAKAKLLAALAIAVARRTRLRATNTSPSLICVARDGRSSVGGATVSRVRMAIRASADTTKVSASIATTAAAPSRLTNQPPTPGPSTCPEARRVSIDALPASTWSFPITDGT